MDGAARLVQMLGSGERRAAGWLRGQVEEAGHGRLKVVCGGQTLEAADLYLAPGLDYKWTHDGGGDSLLRQGDLVAVLVSEDRQDYYLISKVVRA